MSRRVHDAASAADSGEGVSLGVCEEPGEEPLVYAETHD